MRDTNTRGAFLWAICAAIGAACLGREALAGNYAAVVATNTNIQYFSVEMTVGQKLKCTGLTSTPVQMLIDDITYGIQILPDYTSVQASVGVTPLWSAPEFTASYEGGTTSGFFPATKTYWTFGAGALPSGTLITTDVESWTSALYQHFAAEMQEHYFGGAFYRSFDETTQTFHAALFARMEHVPGLGGGDALGLGTSESLGTLSESRHYQTPHIVANPNEVWCVSVGPGTYTGLQVFVKGRVVVNAGDALVENADMVVY